MTAIVLRVSKGKQLQKHQSLSQAQRSLRFIILLSCLLFVPFLQRFFRRWDWNPGRSHDSFFEKNTPTFVTFMRVASAHGLSHQTTACRTHFYVGRQCSWTLTSVSACRPTSHSIMTITGGIRKRGRDGHFFKKKTPMIQCSRSFRFSTLICL